MTDRRTATPGATATASPEPQGPPATITPPEDDRPRDRTVAEAEPEVPAPPQAALPPILQRPPTPQAPPPRATRMSRALARLPGNVGLTIPPALTTLAATVREHSPRVDMTEVVRAYQYADEAHAGQRRSSGEPYITHPVAVANTLASMGLDTAALVAALLHDVVEDTPASLQQVSDFFSPEVALLVDGVTKLERIKVSSKQEQQAETLRKMFLAMAEDIRVLLIKLADRLHNMQTLQYVSRDKQKRVAQETLDIYAPLAHRLGISQLKLQLEDLGFRWLHPKRHAEIVAMVEDRQPERAAYLDEVMTGIRDDLRTLRIRAEVQGRPKHYWSIYEKMVLRGREFDEIHDLVGVRIITGSVRDCYAVLGQIHGHWKPIPGRFKDYIGRPKFNLYQSLHTSVIGPHGRPLELQIRTRAMHNTAEYGVAAHWKYKDAARGAEEAQGWIDETIEWQADVNDPEVYLESLKLDLYADEVFVLTPNGDAVSLPAGSTPIDFAYAIHTEVGNRCVGARVNDRLVPLDHHLANGDVVDIMTSKADNAGPSRDWLQIAASPRAKAKIRAWFNRERREDAIDRGREAVVRALRRRGISYARATRNGELTAVAKDMSYKDLDAMFKAVGDTHVAAGTVVHHVEAYLGEVDDVAEAAEPSAREVEPTPIRIQPGSTDDINVDGDAGMLVTLARCCTPVPGDRIRGYVTRSRGVSIHREDCTNAVHLWETEPERFVPVEWSGGASRFLVAIAVKALDRKNLLRDITHRLGEMHVDIQSANVSTNRDRVATLQFTFETADTAHLDEVLRMVRNVESVYDAYRVLPRAA